MPDQFTEEEVLDLPQTETIFDQQPLEFDKHTWLQEGYMAIDQCCGHPPVSLPSGSLLIKENGRYRLVDEVTRK